MMLCSRCEYFVFVFICFNMILILIMTQCQKFAQQNHYEVFLTLNYYFLCHSESYAID